MADLLDHQCGHSSCANAGTYELPGGCSNCHKEYRLRLTKGHEAPFSTLGIRCPNCGCMKVGASYPSAKIEREPSLFERMFGPSYFK